MEGDYIIAILPEVLSMQFLKGNIPKILNTIKPEKRYYNQDLEFLFWELSSVAHDQFFYADWTELNDFLNQLEYETPRFAIEVHNSKTTISYSPNGYLVGFGAIGVGDDSSCVDEWGDPSAYEMYQEIRLICVAKEASNDTEDV